MLDVACDILQRFEVVHEAADTTARLAELLRQTQHSGRGIHDCNIVATMLAHGIPAVLTDNSRNFSAFGDCIQVESLR